MVPYLQLPNIDEMSIDGSGGGHCGADEMCAPATPLAALKIAVAGRSAAFALGEAVAVHSDAHTAPGLAPLESGLAEDIGQTLFLSHAPHLHRTGDDDGAHIGGDMFAPDILRRHAQIFQPRVGAGANEDGIQLDILNALARLEVHVLQSALHRLPLVGVFLLLRVGDAAGHVNHHARIGSPRHLWAETIDIDLVDGIKVRAGVAGELLPGGNGLLEHFALRSIWAALD